MKPNSHKARLFKRQQSLCCWCGQRMTVESVSIEHIIPLSLGADLGGLNCYENKALAHKDCNNARGSDILQEPHASQLFSFVRERLAELNSHGQKRHAKGHLSAWTCILLRLTPHGWVGMAGNMRKSGRADRLRVTPPYRNRILAISDIGGAIR